MKSTTLVLMSMLTDATVKANCTFGQYASEEVYALFTRIDTALCLAALFGPQIDAVLHEEQSKTVAALELMLHLIAFIIVRCAAMTAPSAKS